MHWLIVLGVATGMRAMTGMAVMCWFAYLGRTPMHGWAFWAAYLVSAIVFSVLALGEYVGDTLPRTPNRTAPGPAVSRMLFGAVVGALAANTLLEPAAGGAILGLLGAVASTWGGFRARRWLSGKLGHDLPVALCESAFALGLALLAAGEIAHGVWVQARWWWA